MKVRVRSVGKSFCSNKTRFTSTPEEVEVDAKGLAALKADEKNGHIIVIEMPSDAPAPAPVKTVTQGNKDK